MNLIVKRVLLTHTDVWLTTPEMLWFVELSAKAHGE